MRAPLSIVIPTLNAEAELPACCSSMTEGLEAGIVRELIISDGGSEDGTQSFAEAAGAVVLIGPAGRGGQLRRGCEAAEGAWLLVLHADTVLSPGWTQVVLNHMQQFGDSAGFFRLAFRAKGIGPTVVSTWANKRSKWFGLPYGDQGLLISRSLYRQIGGYPNIPLMEDVAISRALRGQLRALPIVATTSPDKYERQGWFRRGARNLWTLLRYLLGARPEDLAKQYR